MSQSQIPVVLFVDEKIQLPANLISLFEACKEKRGNHNGLCVDVRRYKNIAEIDANDNTWLLATNGNGFRMTKTRRFTPASFKLTEAISPQIKNIIVVDPSRNKNPEGMISNIFAWVLKANDGVSDQPFYGSPKQTSKKSRNRGRTPHHFRISLASR